VAATAAAGVTHNANAATSKCLGIYSTAKTQMLPPWGTSTGVWPGNGGAVEPSIVTRSGIVGRGDVGAIRNGAGPPMLNVIV
jgi:hypothetical protein